MTAIQLIYLPKRDTGIVSDTKPKASSLGLAEYVLKYYSSLYKVT